LLPLNPAKMGAVPLALSFNTAVSFATNTNWQAYGGETTLSYLTQMLGLTVQNFLSAATGLAVMAAHIRGFVRRESKGIGNFWVDMTRSTLYVLLPLSVVLGILLVSQGVVQTFGGYASATLLQPTKASDGVSVTQQLIAVGPAASQVAIKQLGSNGGGFFNVNSAHPFENPTPLSNWFELLAIFLLGGARRIGIRTVMITGDNPMTAAAIAAEAGVDGFLAEATPEAKLDMIREQQRQGHLVAMTGDGTNDAPALAHADVAVAMNTGTQAAEEAGNMVDLDSNPTKLLEIVEIGKQMLMTRGALTTFSIANDVAKYFAIIPAAFAVTYPSLGVLNIMHLHSPASAIMSAVIFNALIIVTLIPLALRGIKYRAVPASEVLRRNVLVYGLGGVLIPFPFIKIIDMMIAAMGVG
jgi:soluble P-type ATPase